MEDGKLEPQFDRNYGRATDEALVAVKDGEDSRRAARFAAALLGVRAADFLRLVLSVLF